MPNAFPRSAGNGNDAASVASTAGVSNAPNTPCSARPVSNIPVPVAAPPSADAAANPVSPTSRARRLPIRSLIRPPSSSKPPYPRANNVITHCRAGSDIPNARCTDGKAMFTMVRSMPTIS
jgi:hypothetical protein